MLSQDQQEAMAPAPDFPGFVVTEAEKTLCADLSVSATGFAAATAGQFEAAGSTPMVAASLAAHVLLRAAWQFAGVVRIAVDGVDPEPANFIGLAKDITDRVVFDIPSIRAAYAQMADDTAGVA